jgi:MYXO-CTERM domain-containing protein
VQLPEDGDAGDGLGDDDLAATGGHPSSTVLALLALAAAGAVAVRRRRTR